MAIVTACSTGTHNVGEAAEAIRRGDCIAIVAGASEVPIHEVVYVGFANMRGLGMPRPGEPLETVSRPFDLTRNGFVLGEAAEAIRRGDCIAVVTGASEVPIHEVVYVGFANMRGLGMPRPGEPMETVSRPFDLTRNGFVLGEGAAALMVEDLELAKARGANIYAEVVGYGSAADAHDMIQPVEKGDGSRRAMLMALERRGVPADEVDMINPHGTSTPLGDKRETEAIWAVFGDHTPEIAISATKSMTGHMMGAAGAFEAFATVKSVYEQCAPATLNYRDPDPECDLWVVQETQAHPIRYALSNNIGLGGHNGAVIFKRYDGD
jgi:3-oxoacyl-(acyl-carrier-protein) synthase